VNDQIVIEACIDRFIFLAVASISFFFQSETNLALVNDGRVEHKTAKSNRTRRR